MPITWRPAAWTDIEPSLSIQPRNRGDALVGAEAALDCWRYVSCDPFFASAILEATPAIQGQRLIGFGASVLISPAFADAEIGNPRPDINSRVMAAIHSGQAVLATRAEVGRANAGDGIDVLVLYGNWRDEILKPTERYAVQTLLASSFTEWLAGYKIRRILSETSDEASTEFSRRSVVYQAIAEFPGLGRVTHLMTAESVKAVPGSLGNVIFSFREPVLRLRESDQELLSAALSGATDQELTGVLGITFSAVKARWRSIFLQVAESMPDLVSDVGNREGRGSQKRHRVLAYVRSHPGELRPYDWKTKYKHNGLAARAGGQFSGK
jgi:hypothetical protein